MTQDAQADASGFQRCFGRAHVAQGCGKLSFGLLQILERRGLAFIQITGALLDNLRQIELGARLVSCALGGNELVLGGTCSGLSISSNGSPRLTRSPTLAIRRVTRPENGVRTGVLASSLNAIWLIADR